MNYPGIINDIDKKLAQMLAIFHPLDNTSTTNAPLTTTATPTGQCNGIPTTDWSCCSNSNQCNKGRGDCDLDSHCAGRLTCGNNNCHNDFSSAASNWASSADCCEGMTNDLIFF